MMNFFRKKYPIKLYIYKSNEEIGEIISKKITNQIQNYPNTILGLATGSSPIPLYKNLINEHRNHGISFKEVITFNLDEYIDLDQKYNDQSYRNFMNENLFSKIDIIQQNTFFPSKENPKSYDKKIKCVGGIDVQILGLGVNGHIAFNEPNTPMNIKTHIVKITDSTKKANARFFDNNEENVPSFAVTMGLKTILSAKKIILVATGKNKAEAISKLFSNKYDPEWPCTTLIFHKNVSVYVDFEAASLIKNK